MTVHDHRTSATTSTAATSPKTARHPAAPPLPVSADVTIGVMMPATLANVLDTAYTPAACRGATSRKFEFHPPAENPSRQAATHVSATVLRAFVGCERCEALECGGRAAAGVAPV